MKTAHQLLIAFALIAVTLVACKPRQLATVVRNCTGTYLRLDDDGRDYKVCNLDMVNDFADGTEVEVHVRHIDDCTDPQVAFVCHMAYNHEGWIEIQKID